MDKKEKSSNYFVYFMFGLCTVFVIFVIIGFVVFANREEEVIEQRINGGEVILNYTNNINGLRVTNIVPTTDAIGMKNSLDGSYFDFSVDNARSVEYEISIVKDDNNSTISDEDIRVYLEKEESGTYTEVFGPDKFVGLKKNSELGSKVGSMVLTSAKRTKSMTDNYRLRLWLSDKSLLVSGNYSVEVLVNGKAR